MGKRHLLHVKSANYSTSEGLSSGPKLPLATDLMYGELAICYAASAETISLKNSANDIVYLNIPKVKFDSENALNLVEVNGVSGEVTDKLETIVIEGDDIKVSSEYETIEYPTPFEPKASHVTSSNTIDEAFLNVEKTISALTQEVLDDEVVTQRAVEALANAAGTILPNDEIKYVVNENANYIHSATSLANADDILDAKLYDVEQALAEAGKVENIVVNNVTGTVENKIASVTINSDNITYSGDVTVFDAISSINQSISSVSVSSPKKTISVDGTGRQIDVNIDNNTIISAATGVLSVDSAKVTSGISKYTVLNGIVSTQKTSGNTKYNDLTISGNSIAVSSAYTSVEYPEAFRAKATNVSGSDKIDSAFTSVEKTISALTKEVIDDEEVFANSIAALCLALGGVVNAETKKMEYIPSDAPYISAATSHNNAVLILATELANLSLQTKSKFTSLENRIQNAFDDFARINGLQSITFLS